MRLCESTVKRLGIPEFPWQLSATYSYEDGSRFTVVGRGETSEMAVLHARVKGLALSAIHDALPVEPSAEEERLFEEEVNLLGIDREVYPVVRRRANNPKVVEE